ncbi:hypothetical protein [Clostridium estertheticum]|uniref:AttH domain-containing protein n=1 Tax=Clostridium estertheticum TaxID=238834 RepID=A0A7Y3SZI3_9CLOT|nr:hypothetical protein [Clostridium estertheticum]MBW9172720.1 hypothetical protein [Clostridium estertheticum]NNU78261.1 hypothetical protein [Clostridium estertheticum]WBL49554.1 hypothetical protein LOR37_22180 [Clostridium estertheticum]WLC77745.1 hypothetical protein KTC99_22595 [Clostridium estertheticum]
MPKLGDVYERGNFFQQLVGAHKPSVDAMLSDRGYFGLVPSATFAYGCVRSEDGEIYELVRRFSRAKDESSKNTFSMLFIESTNVDGVSLRFDQERMKDAANSNDVEVFKDGNEAVWKSTANCLGKAFELRFSEDEFSWKEEGFFSLSGQMIKPGLHWYLPGRDYGTYYVSHIFEVEGKFEGRKVKGMIGFDQNYMGEGGNLYTNKDLVLENKGHIVWYTWATKYKDGTVEAGHLMLGHDRLGFAVITDGLNVVATQSIEGKVVKCADSPFAEKIEVTVDGERWEFLPDPRGKMPDMLLKHPPTPQQEGRWRRVGDTREPEVWFAWGETEPKHGCERETKFPTRR